MLFLIKTPEPALLAPVDEIAGDDDRDLLLISDAVYLARPGAARRLSGFGFDGIYADFKAVEDRGLRLDHGCEAIDMRDIVGLIARHEKIVNL